MSSASVTSSSSPHTPRDISAHPKRVIFILGALTAFASLAIDMYLAAFPSIASDLKVPIGEVELTVSLFLLGMGIGQALYGPISDRLGRRGPLLFGALLYAGSAVGCALSQSIGSLLFFRVLMALGGSAGGVVTRAIVRDWFDAKQSAHVFSVLMLVMGAAPILAPLLGGQLLLFTGWRGIFVLLVIFGVFCAAAVAFVLPESLPVERRAKGGFGQVFKNYWQLLRHRRFLYFAISSAFCSGLIFSYITGASTVFMEVHDISAQKFGFFFGANSLGLIAASQLNRFLLKRHTTVQILSTCFNIVAACMVLLFVHGLTGWGGLPLLCFLLFFTLSSLGIIFPNVTALAMEPFPELAGSASALVGSTQYVIGFCAGTLVGFFHNGTALPMTGIMAFCGIGAWLMSRRALKVARPVEPMIS